MYNSLTALSHSEKQGMACQISSQLGLMKKAALNFAGTHDFNFIYGFRKKIKDAVRHV